MRKRSISLRFPVLMGALLLLTGCSSSMFSTEEVTSDIKAEPNQAYQQNYQLALEYLKRKQIGAAEDKLKRAIQFRPNAAKAHNALGAVYEERGQFTAALLSYRKAGKADPNLYLARMNEARLLCLYSSREGAASEAIGIYDGVIAETIADTAAAAETGAGDCYARTNRASEARQRYLRALNIVPGYAKAQAGLANLP